MTIASAFLMSTFTGIGASPLPNAIDILASHMAHRVSGATVQDLLQDIEYLVHSSVLYRRCMGSHAGKRCGLEQLVDGRADVGEIRHDDPDVLLQHPVGVV